MDWFGKIDKNPKIYSVYSIDPSASKSFADFKEDDDASHLRLLYCIDALNEGINIDDISGVILLRPTVLPIIYKQQIGRALSASKNHESVIFDIVMNIENLYSIGAIEEEMEIATTYYRSLGEGEAIVNERFQVIDEFCDCKALFEKLENTLFASWDVMYSFAVDYYQKNGNLEIPARYKTEEGYSLGRWIFNQKGIRKGQIEGSLTEEQIAKLVAIGMIWDKLDFYWQRNYLAACEYYREHRNLNVPSNYVDKNYVDKNGVRLGSWLSYERQARSGKRTRGLSPTQEQIERLDKIGMIWGNALDYKWEQGFAEAKAYREANGNLDVMVSYVCEDCYPLGEWLHSQRTHRKRIPKEKRQVLIDLGARGMD